MREREVSKAIGCQLKLGINWGFFIVVLLDRIGFFSTLLGFTGFGVGVSAGLTIGYFCFIYFQPNDVKIYVMYPVVGLGDECQLIHGQNLKNVVITVRHWALPPRPIPRLLPVAFNISNFGTVDNGVSVNMEVFERAVLEIRNRGGGLGIGLRHRSISRAT